MTGNGQLLGHSKVARVSEKNRAWIVSDSNLPVGLTREGKLQMKRIIFETQQTMANGARKMKTFRSTHNVND